MRARGRVKQVLPWKKKKEETIQPWMPPKTRERICTNCYYIGEPKRPVPTSPGLFLLMVLGFIILLFIPIIGWAIDFIAVFVLAFTGNAFYCPKCSSKGMIPLDTPKAKELIAQTQRKEGG